MTPWSPEGETVDAPREPTRKAVSFQICLRETMMKPVYVQRDLRGKPMRREPMMKAAQRDLREPMRREPMWIAQRDLREPMRREPMWIAQRDLRKPRMKTVNAQHSIGQRLKLWEDFSMESQEITFLKLERK